MSVRDYGHGIAPEHLPRLTERFYRVDATQSRAKNGTGLGLAIVKHILTRHRGRLTITSRVNQGSSLSPPCRCIRQRSLEHPRPQVQLLGQINPSKTK